MRITILKVLAKHKYLKLLRSKLLWLFFIGGFVITLFTLLPLIVLKVGEATANIPVDQQIYFSLVVSFSELFSFFGALIGVIIGGIVIRQDAKDGTIYPFLAKPITRMELLVGKALGGVGVLVLLWLVQLFFFWILFFVFVDLPFRAIYPLNGLFDLLNYLMFYFFALVLSQRMNAAFTSMIIVVLWALSSIAIQLVTVLPGVWATVAHVIYFLNPAYDKLSFWEASTSQAKFSGPTYWQSLLYFLTFCATCLTASLWMFHHREFTPSD